MTVEYRSPRNQAELEDTFQCSDAAFGGSLSFFTRIVRHDPWFCMDNARACFVDGKAVSVVQIFHRPIRVGTSAIKMGGLGSVGTHPDHRRKGYSLNVLRDSVRYMRSAGYDISVLYTGSQSHYARAGWVVYPAYSLRLTLPESPIHPPEGLTIQTCDPDRDLPELMAVYDRFNATRSGTLVRTEAYWRKRPQWRDDPPLFHVTRRNGQLTAYLVGNRWRVLEFGCMPGEDAALTGLFAHLCHQAQTEEAKEVRAEPCPLAFGRTFETLGCAVHRQEGCSQMARIINLESLLDKLTPVLASRLCASDLPGWEGSVRLRYESDERTLQIGDEEIAVVRSTPSPDIDLTLSQEQLLKLLFGNMRAEHIACANNLPLGEDDIALLDALFPRDELFSWRTDGF